MSALAVYDCMLFFMRAARPERVRETFQLVDDDAVRYCLSAEVAGEIHDVLTRRRHQAKFPELTPERVALLLQEINRRCVFVDQVAEAKQEAK